MTIGFRVLWVNGCLVIFEGGFGRLCICRKCLILKAFLAVAPQKSREIRKVRITAVSLFLERTGTILERTAEGTE